MTNILSSVVGKCKEWNWNRINIDGVWKICQFLKYFSGGKVIFKSLACFIHRSWICTKIRKITHQGIKKDEYHLSYNNHCLTTLSYNNVVFTIIIQNSSV